MAGAVLVVGGVVGVAGAPRRRTPARLERPRPAALGLRPLVLLMGARVSRGATLGTRRTQMSDQTERQVEQVEKAAKTDGEPTPAERTTEQVEHQELA